MIFAAECAVLRADTEYYCESPDMDTEAVLRVVADSGALVMVPARLGYSALFCVE